MLNFSESCKNFKYQLQQLAVYGFNLTRSPAVGLFCNQFVHQKISEGLKSQHANQILLAALKRGPDVNALIFLLPLTE